MRNGAADLRAGEHSHPVHAAPAVGQHAGDAAYGMRMDAVAYDAIKSVCAVRVQCWGMECMGCVGSWKMKVREEKMNQQKEPIPSVTSKPVSLEMRRSFLIAVCVIGALALMLLLAMRKAAPQTLEARLSAALSKLEGAGSVEVVIYQKEAERSAQTSAVFSAWGGSSKTLEPGGVLVLAQGADVLRVRMQIVDAVQALLDVPAAHIEVLKKAD